MAQLRKNTGPSAQSRPGTGTIDEARFQAFITASPDIFYRMSADWTELLELQDKGVLTPASDPRHWLDDHVPERDQHSLTESIRQSIEEGRPLDQVIRIRKANGMIGWFRSRAVPVFDGKGQLAEWLGTATEVTAVKLAEDDLQHSASMLEAAMEVGGVGIWDWDLLTDKISWSAEHYRLAGYKVGEVEPSYAAWAASVHEEDRPAVESALDHAQRTGEEFVAQYRVVHADGDVRWTSARGRFLRDCDGQPVRMIGAMIDTTEQRRQAERQQILVSELQHRVRNLLGMVQSIVRQTASQPQAIEVFAAHLIGRLQAIGRTQAMLTRSPGADVDLTALIEEVLVGSGAAQTQFEMDGPRVLLSPHLAEVVGMAMHELAVNSIKFGAFGSGGRVTIAWHVQASAAEPELALRWHERHSREGKMNKSGFGTRLIEERIPYELAGKGTISVTDREVVAELLVPLSDRPSVLETGTQRIGRQERGDLRDLSWTQD